MQGLRKLYALFIIIILFILIPYASAQEATEDEVRTKIINGYVLVEDAYSAGGNVSSLVAKLNQAINLLQDYKENNDPTVLQEAGRLADEVIDQVPMVKEAGETRVFWDNIYLTSGALIIGAIGILLYLYLPKVFFGLWLGARGENRLRVRRTRAKRSSMLIDEEVWAVVLAIVVVIAVFSVSQLLLAGRVVEPFSELGLLGKNRKIGDYPTNLVVGDEAFFYVYVGNHMGKPMYYRVLVKLGTAQTPIDPAPIPPIYIFDRILEHNETWIFPVSIPMDEPANNLRLIVELWIYNSSIGDFQYHSRWTQLWINVTGI